MMLTDNNNDNKQAKVLNDLASFYVSSTDINFSPPDSPHKVTPPSSDSEQDPPSTSMDQQALQAFSSLFVNPSQDLQGSTSRRRKNHHPHQNRKQSIVAVAMATSVDKDRSRRGPQSMARLECEDEYQEMEIPLKGGDDEEDVEDNENHSLNGGRAAVHKNNSEGSTGERDLSALEKLKRRSQSVDVRRVQRSRSDELIMEMDHNRRSTSQDARRRTRRRSAEGGDLEDSSLHATVKSATEGLSALEKLTARSNSLERRRVAPGRSQSDDLLERELRHFCSSHEPRRRHGHGHSSDEDDDRSKCTQSTTKSTGVGTKEIKGNNDTNTCGGDDRPISSRSIDRGLNPPVRRKSSDLIDMEAGQRQSPRKHRNSFEATNHDNASLVQQDGEKNETLKPDERSSGSSERPRSNADSRERRRGLPERSKSDDLIDLDPSRYTNNSHDSRRRARRPTRPDGDDSSVVSVDIRPVSVQGINIRKNSAEGEGSQASSVTKGQGPNYNADDHSNTSSEKPKSSRSSSRERRRAVPEGSKSFSENTAAASADLDKTETLGSHFGKRRGRKPTGEDASYIQSIVETPKIKNTNSLDGRGSRRSTRGNIPSQRSKSVDVAFEMDVGRRSSTSDERRQRPQRASSRTRDGMDNLDDDGEVVKQYSVASLVIDARKRPQSARDVSTIMAMPGGSEGENERRESVRPERRTRSSSQAKWAELRRGMESIDKKAQANLEERRNGRQTQRDRRGARHSDTSPVVSSSGTKDELSARPYPRRHNDRDSDVGSKQGSSGPISERRIKRSESFDAKSPPGYGTSPSASAPFKESAADPMSEPTKSEQIPASTGHSDRTESREESDKVEPKKPQSSAFRTLLGAKKAASTIASNDESGGGVAPSEAISDESMHKGRNKGMNVLKKLLSVPSATPSEKVETVADAAKKGTRWGGLRSGVDFTSRLIRSTADNKKTNVDSERAEEAPDDRIATAGNEINASGSPPQGTAKGASSDHHNVEGSREDSGESEENSLDRSSNHLRASDSQNRAPVGQANNHDRNERVDPAPPAPSDSAALIAPELYEILNGPRAADSVKQQRPDDRRAMMTSLAAPSLRFDPKHVDGVAPRFQPDTIIEEDEEEDKSNSRHPPFQTPDRGDEESIVDENEGIIGGDLDGDETEDEPETFLSPLKCMQLKFQPTFSPAGDLLVAIHALDHEQEDEGSDDDDSVIVHGLKMDAFELYDDTIPSESESDQPLDEKDVANDMLETRQLGLATEYETLQRQLIESRLRIQSSNEALRTLQREIQQQTRLLEETKKRGRALKRVLREQNILLLFN